MAPRKGSSRRSKTNALRSRKLASFLKDFDREGKERIRGPREFRAGLGAVATALPAVDNRNPSALTSLQC